MWNYTFQIRIFCSVKSKTPIVPVALIDSYKVFGVNSLKKVNTQVHFLEPKFINYINILYIKFILGWSIFDTKDVINEYYSDILTITVPSISSMEPAAGYTGIFAIYSAISGSAEAFIRVRFILTFKIYVRYA